MMGFSCGMWGLWLGHVGSSSLTRDQTRAPALGAQSLSHLATKEVPQMFFLSNTLISLQK